MPCLSFILHGLHFSLYPVSGTIKELKSDAVPFVSQIVRHYTIVGVAQQAGPCPIKPQTR